MQAQTEQKSPFTAAFEAWQSSHRDPAWVAELRQKAFASFRANGLPTRRNEAWKYTSLRPVSDATFDIVPRSFDMAAVKAAIGDLVRPDAVNFVFVNGYLAPELSSQVSLKGVTIRPFSEALDQPTLRLQLEKAAMSSDAFTQLNTAFFAGGLAIEVASSAIVTQALHLLHVTTAEAHLGKISPRHFINVGAGSELTLFETHVSLDDSTKSLTNSLLEGIVQKDARLKLARIERQGAAALHIGRGQFELAQSAVLESFCFSAGPRLNRYDLEVSLTGEGAEAELNGLYLTKAGQVVDHHTTIHHQVPNAVSRQLYKGILDGDSRAVFNGKVVVNRDAQGTSAKQLNRNLLLSADAEIDTKPELLIDADDVKCAHGASIGQLDDDQIFYLRSRGLRGEEARRLLTMAFADEVLMKVPNIREWLRPLTMGYLS